MMHILWYDMPFAMHDYEAFVCNSILIFHVDIKDLDTVIEELISNQHLPHHVWHDLGLGLGLYQPTLEDIKEDYNGDSKKCFRECMSAWLKGKDKVREKGGPSWSTLALALDKEEQCQIAASIREKYL